LNKKTLNKLIQYSFLLVLIFFLFIGGPQLFDTRLLQELWNLGHIVLFALFSTIVLRDSMWIKSKKIFLQFILIFLLTIILGMLIEGIQQLIGRTADSADFFGNIVGTSLAFVFSKNFSIKKPVIIRVSKTFVIMLFLIAIWPSFKISVDEIQAQIDFPVIADFENIFEIEKWYGQSNIKLNSENVIHGNNSLRAELLTKKYSGISISYFPTDWQNFTKIKFGLFLLDSDSLRLTCRMHDKIHNNKYNDRFNKSFYVKQGWNEISINLEEVINAPSDRIMDIRKIKNFALFAVRLKERKIIYFDYLRLE